MSGEAEPDLGMEAEIEAAGSSLVSGPPDLGENSGTHTALSHF